MLSTSRWLHALRYLLAIGKDLGAFLVKVQQVVNEVNVIVHTSKVIV